MLKQGTMIDATLVAAQAAPPRPVDGAAGASPHDRDANWTRQNGKSYFGYKAHVAMDQGSRLIRRSLLTPAIIYESQVADDLVMGDEKAVYADRAYKQKQRRASSRASASRTASCIAATKNQPALPPWQRRRNRLIAPIRATIEHLFATFKRGYGYRRVRYFSLAPKRPATRTPLHRRQSATRCRPDPLKFSPNGIGRETFRLPRSMPSPQAGPKLEFSLLSQRSRWYWGGVGVIANRRGHSRAQRSWKESADQRFLLNRSISSPSIGTLVEPVATSSAIIAPVPGPSWKPCVEKPNWWNTPSEVELLPTTGMPSGM